MWMKTNEVMRGVFECLRCGKENQANYVIQLRNGDLSLGGCETCYKRQKNRQVVKFGNQLKLAAERYEAMIADLGKFIVQHYSRFMSKHSKESSPLKLAMMILTDKWDSSRDCLTQEELNDMFGDKK